MEALCYQLEGVCKALKEEMHRMKFIGLKVKL